MNMTVIIGFLLGLCGAFALWALHEKREKEKRGDILRQIAMFARRDGSLIRWMFHPHLPQDLKQGCAQHITKFFDTLKKISPLDPDEVPNLEKLSRETYDHSSTAHGSEGEMGNLYSWGVSMKYAMQHTRFDKLVELLQELEKLGPQGNEAWDAVHAKRAEASRLTMETEPDWIRVKLLVDEGIEIARAALPQKMSHGCEGCV